MGRIHKQDLSGFAEDQSTPNQTNRCECSCHNLGFEKVCLRCDCHKEKKCCEKCYCDHPMHENNCDNTKCPCHKEKHHEFCSALGWPCPLHCTDPHTQQKGWKDLFGDEIWKVLKEDHNDLRRQMIIMNIADRYLTEQKKAFVEMIKKQEASGISVDEYLPIVQSGNFDKMFDYAYEKAKSDLLIKLDEI